MRGIQKRLSELTAERVRPVAISVDPPKVSLDLCKRDGYSFTFLSDPNATVIRRYNLLHVGGSPEGADISRPAEFLLDSRGVVRWVNLTKDFRVRARADQMLAAARAIP